MSRRIASLFASHHTTITMPGRPWIHPDVKRAACRLYELDHISIEDIAPACKMSERTFYRTWALWQQTGDVITQKVGTWV